MTIESRRKEIMSKSRTWGETVEPLPHTLAGPYLPHSQKPDTPTPPHDPLDSEDTIMNDRVGDQAREDRQLPDEVDAHLHSDVLCGLLDPTLAMTSTRGWSLDLLLETGPNFHDVHRVSATSPDLGNTIRNVFELKGRPLVIEGFHQHPQWPKKMFTLEHFGNNMEENDINVRNVHNWTDTKIPLQDFITKCRTSGPYKEDNEEVRFYGKDLECPKTWENWLQTGGVVPPSLISKGPEDLFRYRPEATPVETLMCYLGIGDTFTPCHKDLCASSGQNLMCYTEGGGSSFWFMTESSIAPVAARYFQELGQELDHENYVITLEELMKAPFKVFVLEQKIGDLVLVPPRSCHQVVNFGGITIKSSWSRMTLKGLSTAYYHELPIYHRVCRPEIYRVKSTIHHTLVGRTKELQTLLGRATRATDNNIIDLVKDIKELLTLYDAVLVEEYGPGHKDMVSRPTSRPPSVEEDICICCDFCGCDIFQSFFECGPSSDGCVVCPGCYVEGRNCKCKNARMQPMQYRDFQQLVGVRTNAVNAVARYEEQCHSSFESKLDLKPLSGKTATIFRAACILYRNRTSIKPTKICRQVKVLQTSHPVDYHSALYCKQCHNTRCFTHMLLDFKVHSVEALLFHDTDATHEKYHSNHQRRLRRNSDPLNQLDLQRHQKQGTPPDRFLQLFDAASIYGDCRPVKADAMNLGWYDNHPQSATAILDDSDEVLSSPLLVTVENPSIPLEVAGVTNTDSQRLLKEILKEVEEVPAGSGGRKPQAYVQVPKAPYSTGPSRCTVTVATQHGEAKEPTRTISRLDPSKPSGTMNLTVLTTARRIPEQPHTIQHPMLAKPRICPQAPDRCQKDNDVMKMNLVPLARSLTLKEGAGPTATTPSPVKSAISSLRFKKKPRENIHNGPDGGSLASSVSGDSIHVKDSSDPPSSSEKPQTNEPPEKKLPIPPIPIESQQSQEYGRAEVNSIAGHIIASTILQGMGSMMMEGANQPGMCNNPAWSNMSPTSHHQQSFNTHYNAQMYGPNRLPQYYGPKNVQNLMPNSRTPQGFVPPGQQHSCSQHNYAAYSANTHPTYPYYPQCNVDSHLVTTQRTYENRPYSANKHYHNRPAQPPAPNFDQHRHTGRPQERSSYFDGGHGPKKRKQRVWDQSSHPMHNNEWNPARPRPSDPGESHTPKKAKHEQQSWRQEGRVTQVTSTRRYPSSPRTRPTNVNETHSLNRPTPEGQQFWKQAKGPRKSRWDIGPGQSRQSSSSIHEYDRPDHARHYYVEQHVVQTPSAPDTPAPETPADRPSNQDGIPDRSQLQPTITTEKAPPARTFTPSPTAVDSVSNSPLIDGNKHTASPRTPPRTPPSDLLMDDSEPSNWEYGYEQDEYESTPVAFRFQGVQAHDDDEVNLGDEFDLTTNPWSPSPK